MLMVQMFFVTFAPSFFIGSSRLRYEIHAWAMEVQSLIEEQVKTEEKTKVNKKTFLPICVFGKKPLLLPANRFCGGK